MTDRIRVLVVDDSAFARRVVRQVLERAGDIEVVDIARDGLEALEKIANLAPDVVTLDLMMPGLDGIAVLAALPREGGPRVVVVSSSGVDTELGAAALAAGAIDLVEKPTTQATDRLYELADELLDRVRLAAAAKVRYAPAQAPAPVRRPAAARAIDAVLIGCSTGGPQALTRVLPGLAETVDVPIVVVVHMPPGYIEAFARRLDALCPLSVVEGHDGIPVTRGMVVLAPAGAHFQLVREAGVLSGRLDYRRMPGELHQPSVDTLFTSAAAVLGARSLGVVLTGMGNDGLVGARALREAGAAVIAEHESSCVVYGMPRAIIENDLADEVCSLDRMAAAITARI